MRKYFIWGLFVILLIFTRFYNLDRTARFTEDESKDLVGIHQVFVDKKLTLVGPTNEQGTKVFSSLTFYMLLPFTIIGKFDPISPHYGAAFWGVIVSILLIYFVNKINSKFTVPIALLTLVWFPFLETSRWAWNPNLIPLWVISGIILIQIPKKYARLLAGIIFGFAVHSHYYSIFAVGIFMAMWSAYFLYKKQYSSFVFLGLGFTISILPFVIFDLRHSPGIFLPNLFSQSKSVGGGLDMGLILQKFTSNIWSLMIEYTQATYLAVPLMILSLMLLIQDIKRKSFSLIYFTPWIFQSIIIACLPQFFPHYLIPGLIFFLVWVIYKRGFSGKLLSYSILIILILRGFISIYSQLTTPTSIPDISITRQVEKNIKNEIVSRNLKNINIAVLASPDTTTSGKKYRDLLLVDGNIHILTKNEYQITDHLFIISTSSEQVVRNDPATEIQRFKKGKLASVMQIDNSGWFIYHFLR
ncbi:MAG TPA: hypothetical protein VFI61_01380 [Patescibacteria group bacterium]|nr:hypothetical protein [Patescibacteria group bacterium]